jgi:hypothetical protein
MGFYSTTLEQPKVHQKTSDCGPKTASRNFFTYPVKTSYQNRSNFLIPNQEKSKTTHKTASGRSIWLGRDPIEEDGGINLYAFVGNDAVQVADFLGLFGSVWYVATGKFVEEAVGIATAESRKVKVNQSASYDRETCLCHLVWKVHTEGRTSQTKNIFEIYEQKDDKTVFLGAWASISIVVTNASGIWKPAVGTAMTAAGKYVHDFKHGDQTMKVFDQTKTISTPWMKTSYPQEEKETIECDDALNNVDTTTQYETM